MPVELPSVHNIRSPEQWKIISNHINFENKTVLDLGCGYGDIIFRCAKAGAKKAVGIDRITFDARRFKQAEVWFYNVNLNYLTLSEVDYDVIICFSVLPYLIAPDNLLEWMKFHSTISLIECQYNEDGPGHEHIKNDTDMRDWLEKIGWKSVESIGKTLVQDRQKYRTIWMCQ